MIKEIQRTQAPARNINITFSIVIFLGFLVTISTYAFYSPPSGEYDICVDTYDMAVKGVTRGNAIITESCIDKFENSPYELRDCVAKLAPMPVNSCVNKGTGKVMQEDTKINKLTLRDRFGLSDCRFTNDYHRIGKYNLEWMAYDIACEPGKTFEVKSPGAYSIEKIGYGNNLGDYIILRGYENNSDTRIVLAHIRTSYKESHVFKDGEIIGDVNISGASTNYHIHIELWDGFTNVSREFALGEKYKSINGTSLLNHRGWDFGQPDEVPPTYYFTHYDLGDVSQNDSTPCIGASGKDLCYLEKTGVRTMALTSDLRKQLGVSFGQKVKLTGDEGCEGIFQVEDEMNLRFRKSPGVKRPGTNYYIKGDLPSMEGGACSVTKL